MDNKFMKMVNFLFLEIQGRKRGGGRPRCGERLYAMKKKPQVIQILPLEKGLLLHLICIRETQEVGSYTTGQNG